MANLELHRPIGGADYVARATFTWLGQSPVHETEVSWPAALDEVRIHVRLDLTHKDERAVTYPLLRAVVGIPEAAGWTPASNNSLQRPFQATTAAECELQARTAANQLLAAVVAMEQQKQARLQQRRAAAEAAGLPSWLSPEVLRRER